MRLLKRFKADTSGTTAMLFGLLLVPLAGAAGMALDFTRAHAVRTEMQRATDATALALVTEARRLSSAQLTDGAALAARGQGIMAAMLPARPDASFEPAQVSRDGRTLRVSASGSVRTTLTALLGFGAVPVSAQAESVFGRIEVALVLDTTGSMGQAGKMIALKEAVSGRGGLIDVLSAANRLPGDVKLSVVPFNTQVQIGTAHRDAPWLRWDITLENRNLSNRAAPSRQAWTGCVSDRDQRYDATSEPATAMQATHHVAAHCHYGKLAPLRPLSGDLEAARAAVEAMQPEGATNVTIGYAMGLVTLRNDTPFGAESSDDGAVSKFMIVLTDGDNTQNRWTGDGGPPSTAIDARLRTACDEARGDARTKRVQVFTIKVIQGNAGLLRGCATKPEMFKEVTRADQLGPVFKEIADAILRTRITS